MLGVRDLTALLWGPLKALSETYSNFLQRDFRLFSTFHNRNGGCLACEPTQHQLDAKNSSLSVTVWKNGRCIVEEVLWLVSVSDSWGRARMSFRVFPRSVSLQVVLDRSSCIP